VDPFRATFIVLAFWLAVLRAYYRIKGRGRVQERVRERWTIAAEFLLGGPFMVGVALYAFHPQVLKPTTFPIGAAWRWTGAAIFAVSLVLLTWIHATLGKNFSSELRVRSDQELVTRGPYRYVRHPMYSAFFLMMIGMGLLSANWLIGAGGVGAAVLLVSLRTRMEEEMMARTFGKRYRQYAAVTGRFLPRLSSRSPRSVGRAC
jgi:protein-S-isoprenylcysteine O-methyltransferase Ste14